MNKLMKLIKDYQSLVIWFTTGIIGIIGIIIKPIRGWIIEFLKYNLPVWIVLIIILFFCAIAFIIYQYRKRLMSKCKYPIGASVMYHNYVREMKVIKYNPLKDELLCSWMEKGNLMKQWFSQSTLTEFKDIDYTPHIISRSTRDNRYTF